MTYRKTLMLAMLCTFLTTAGCPGKDNAFDRTRVKPKRADLARAADVTVDLSEFRQVISEARVLQHWLSGQPTEMNALNNPRLRRRLLINGLENRVIRQFFKRQNLKINPKLLQSLTQKAALGIPPNKDVPLTELDTLTADEDTLNSRLVARFKRPLPAIHAAIKDVAQRHILTGTLLQNSPENEIKHDWNQRNRCVTAELFRVSRVPSSREIDRAINEQGAAVESYYALNPRLFKREARVFVRRLSLAYDKANPEDLAQKKAQLLSWQKEAQARNNFEQLIRKHGPMVDRRSGGRMKFLRSQRPDLYALAENTFSDLEVTQGHVILYQVINHGPAVNRPLSDPRVQRECAAAVLRDTNQLPSVLETTETLVYRLKKGQTGNDLSAFLKEKRIRVTPNVSYCAKMGPRVPGIGLAAPLVPELLALSKQHRVSPPVHVRQEFVVARFIDGKWSEEAHWLREKESFTRTWQRQNERTIVNTWLSHVLRHQPRWVDQRRLDTLTLDDLVEKSP